LTRAARVARLAPQTPTRGPQAGALRILRLYGPGRSTRTNLLWRELDIVLLPAPLRRRTSPARACPCWCTSGDRPIVRARAGPPPAEGMNSSALGWGDQKDLFALARGYFDDSASLSILDARSHTNAARLRPHNLPVSDRSAQAHFASRLLIRSDRARTYYRCIQHSRASCPSRKGARACRAIRATFPVSASVQLNARRIRARHYCLTARHTDPESSSIRSGTVLGPQRVSQRVMTAKSDLWASGWRTLLPDRWPRPFPPSAHFQLERDPAEATFALADRAQASPSHGVTAARATFRSSRPGWPLPTGPVADTFAGANECQGKAPDRPRTPSISCWQLNPPGNE